MPRLREILDRLLIRAVEIRNSEGSDPPSDQDREKRALIAILRERDEEIARLKGADAKRSQLYRKNARKWREKQAEVRQIRQDNRTLRRLLKKRRSRLREVLQRLRSLERSRGVGAFERALTVAGDHIPSDFAGSPARSLYEWSTRAFGEHSLLPWRHWMRLGTYHQYDPRPVTLDRLPCVQKNGGDWPLFSLVTPSFQQAAYLEDTMRSVLDQEYPNLEYGVMDGGSTDGSIEIIRRHQDRLAFWESGADGGQAAAVREGLERSRGEIMGWLNSDDLIFPGTLSCVADYFRRHPEVDVVYGHRIVLNRNGFEIGRWILPPHDSEILAWADFIPQECTFWRRRIYERVGGIDPEFRFALDWDLFLRFQKAGAKIVRLPYFMGGFRIHEEQKNAVTIGTDGYREMKKIRDQALGESFQHGGLHKRVSWLQTRAVMTTLLWRMGIRV